MTRVWTADRVASLKALWLAGDAIRKIADLLGVSESAVANKVYELDLPRRYIRKRVAPALLKPIGRGPTLPPLPSLEGEEL